MDPDDLEEPPCHDIWGHLPAVIIEETAQRLEPLLDRVLRCWGIFEEGIIGPGACLAAKAEQAIHTLELRRDHGKELLVAEDPETIERLAAQSAINDSLLFTLNLAAAIGRLEPACAAAGADLESVNPLIRRVLFSELAGEVSDENLGEALRQTCGRLLWELDWGDDDSEDEGPWNQKEDEEEHEEEDEDEEEDDREAWRHSSGGE